MAFFNPQKKAHDRRKLAGTVLGTSVIYRYRAGVEATMSQYDKLTGVKRLRVRDLNAVRYYATLKAAGLNLLRATLVSKARRQSQVPETGFLLPFPFFKEQVKNILFGFGRMLLPKPPAADGYLELATLLFTGPSNIMVRKNIVSNSSFSTIMSTFMMWRQDYRSD